MFDRAVVVNAKALVILMVLPFAGLLALLFLGQRQRFMAHLAFSLHLYAFLMLLFSLAVLFAKAVSALGGPGIESAGMDNGLSLFNLVASGLYIFTRRSARPTRSRRMQRLAQGAAADARRAGARPRLPLRDLSYHALHRLSSRSSGREGRR